MKCGDVKAGMQVRVSSAKSGRTQQLWRFVTVTERGEYIDKLFVVLV